MNSDTTSPFPTSGEAGGSGFNGGSNETVRRYAQKVHDAVDMLEQKLGSSSDKVMGMQEEYGEMARDQVRANPLAAVGIAFAAGYLFAKIFR